MRREIQRLRRDLERSNVKESVDEEETLADAEKTVVIPNKPSCPQCASQEMASVRMGPKTLIVCKNCQYRKVS